MFFLFFKDLTTSFLNSIFWMNIVKLIKSKISKKDRFISGGYEDKALVLASEFFALKKPAEKKDGYARLTEYSFFEKVV